MKIIHWIGIDDHADKWTIAHFKGNEDKAAKNFELLPDAAGYRKLIKFAKELDGEVRIVYEAGPCGYELYRRLTKAGLKCYVAAPSLTPRKPGERVKTNRRDANKLARYLRAGDMLTLIMVPDQGRESLRDLVRARHAVQKDLVRIRHQITKLVLRYGHRYREGKTAWTGRFWAWLDKIKLEGEHSQFVLIEMISAHRQRLEQRGRYDEAIEAAAKLPEYAPYVSALTVLRGIDRLSAMTILSELGDLRRFATAPQLMAAVGLVPSESSTGDTITRFSITKTGNAHVRHIAIEAAWQYQRRISHGPTIRGRRKGQSQALLDIADKCDRRLNRKFHRMTSRGKRSTVAAVAVGRELMGFIWAIGQTITS
jgi:transposase